MGLFEIAAFVLFSLDILISSNQNTIRHYTSRGRRWSVALSSPPKRIHVKNAFPPPFFRGSHGMNELTELCLTALLDAAFLL